MLRKIGQFWKKRVHGKSVATVGISDEASSEVLRQAFRVDLSKFLQNFQD